MTISTIIINAETDDNNTIYVDDDGGADFTTIQDAINKSKDEDTIFVFNGIYKECITVNKSIRLIGENNKKTIIDGSYLDEPVQILSSNVVFYGFKVINGIDDGYSAGINIYGKNTHVDNCIIKNNDCGIRITFANEVNITNCVINENHAHSIYVIVTSNISISNCDIYNNGNAEGGVPGCIALDSIDDFDFLSNVTIRDCKIHDNDIWAISISRWYKNVIIEYNNIFDNTDCGIYVLGGNAIIKNNQIINNGKGGIRNSGICLSNCINSVVIENNNISTNYNFGLYLLYSRDNSIKFNNFINNKIHVFFIYNDSPKSKNIWIRNYWDNKINPWIKILIGQYDNMVIFPLIYIDRNPAVEPFEIM